jgi:hypothetical protein
MEGYVKLSKLTAELFEQLIEDYLRESDFATEATVENSIFIRMKTTLKKVKQFFASEIGSFDFPCFPKLRMQISEDVNSRSSFSLASQD